MTLKRKEKNIVQLIQDINKYIQIKYKYNIQIYK